MQNRLAGYLLSMNHVIFESILLLGAYIKRMLSIHVTKARCIQTHYIRTDFRKFHLKTFTSFFFFGGHHKCSVKCVRLTHSGSTIRDSYVDFRVISSHDNSFAVLMHIISPIFVGHLFMFFF